MSRFEELKGMTCGKSLPLSAMNEYGEVIIIEGGARFFRVTTAQHNGWCRVKTYWEDGTIEESYRK